MSYCVFGVDPGVQITGYGLVKKDEENRFVPVGQGIIKNSFKENFPLYLQKIYNKSVRIIEEFNPDTLAIEEPFLAKNPRIALKMGQIEGVVTLAGIHKGLEVYTYSTLQVKQAIVGYGRAEKSQVQEMVRIFLSLEEIPRPDDVADALGVAICRLQSMDWEDAIKDR